MADNTYKFKRERLIWIDYTNYRKVREWRCVQPSRLRYGSTEYHREEQWLLHAFDIERMAWRSFAVLDIHGIALEPPGKSIDLEEPTAAEYEAALADQRRLTRELDIALHGVEGAARQASLVDLLGPAEALARTLRRARQYAETYAGPTGAAWANELQIILNGGRHNVRHESAYPTTEDIVKPSDAKEG